MGCLPLPCSLVRRPTRRIGGTGGGDSRNWSGTDLFGVEETFFVLQSMKDPPPFSTTYPSLNAMTNKRRTPSRGGGGPADYIKVWCVQHHTTSHYTTLHLFCGGVCLERGEVFILPNDLRASWVVRPVRRRQYDLCCMTCVTWEVQFM